MIESGFVGRVVRPNDPIDFPDFTDKDVYRVLVTPDKQIPYHDTRALDAVAQFARRYHWDEYIDLGDYFDFSYLSNRSRTQQAQELEGQRVKDDLRVGAALWQKMSHAATHVNLDCKLVWLRGNHDERVDRFENENPAFTGIINIGESLGFNEDGTTEVRCYPDGEAYIIGKLCFTHGQFHNQHAAKSHVERFGMSVCHGHTHRVATYALPHLLPDHARIGINLGCLAHRRMKWHRGKVTAHEHAFGVFYFLPNGFFWYYIPRIFGGCFVGPDGRVYRGSADSDG